MRRVYVGLACAWFLAACAAIPDLEYADAGDDASVGDAAPATDTGALDTGALDTGIADAPIDDVAADALADDAFTFAGDASADAASCPGPGAPPGAGCCLGRPCIGAACNHCLRCIALKCATGTWCCAVENPNQKVTGEVCESEPTDAAACPLTEK